MTKWDYLSLSHALTKHADDMGTQGPYSEGALLDLWDNLCPNELEVIGSETHPDTTHGGGELHLIGLAHVLAEFVTTGFLVRDANASFWLVGLEPDVIAILI